MVKRLVVARLRQLTPSQRAERMQALNRDCERLAVAGIRERYPDADEYEVRMRLGVLRVGPSLMRSAFGWDPASDEG